MTVMKQFALVTLIFTLLSMGSGVGTMGLKQAYAFQQSTPTASVTLPTVTPVPPTPTSIPTQTPVPVVVSTVLPVGDNIPFSSLGQQDKLLYGPSDVSSFSFGLPSEWVVQEGVKLQLNLSVFIPGTDSALGQSYAGSILVRFNNQIIGQIALSRPGDIVATLDIPPAALALAQRDGRHQVGLEFDSGLNCVSNMQMNVLVRASSLVILPHTVGPLPTDLNLLPRPLIQRSFIPDSILVITADTPSAAELQAAMSISSGLGRMSNGRALLTLLPIGQLTDDLRKANHIVMVGKPEALSALASGLTIPTSATITGTPAATADDGIIQMQVSPWSPAHAVLFVTGGSDAAIIKAGQAVSAGQVRPIEQPNVAIVSDIHQTVPPAVAEMNRTFADLGYTQQVMNPSDNIARFRFFLPADKAVNGEAYLDLWFSHSGQLDFGRSNASILLNDQPIGGLTLSQDTTKLTRVRFGLPRSAMHTGNNEIQVQTDLIRTAGCYINDGNGLWFSIMPESILNIPLGEGSGATQRLYDLSLYPSMFLVEPNMNKLGFVVAQNDPSGWQAASKIAFGLGTRSDSSFSDVAVAYADSLSEELRTTRDLIIVGRPSSLAVMTELNDKLPAPFEKGSDLALEATMRVQYRIPPGASIGYLQLFASPWNATRAILGVLGSDNAAVTAAANALIIPEQRSRLDGTLAIIDRQQIVTSNSLSTLSLSAAVAPTAQVDVPAVNSPSFERPGWLMPTIIGLIVALIILIIGVILFALRRRQVGVR